jgi:GGDEF domain-containing protein
MVLSRMPIDNPSVSPVVSEATRHFQPEPLLKVGELQPALRPDDVAVDQQYDRRQHARRHGARRALLILDVRAATDADGHQPDTEGGVVAGAVEAILRRRAGEIESVARVSATEFAIAVAWTTGIREIADLARRIIEEIEAPPNGSRVRASIGIAFNTRESCDQPELLRRARTARRYAMTKSNRRIAFFSAEMERAAPIAALPKPIAARDTEAVVPVSVVADEPRVNQAPPVALPQALQASETPALGTLPERRAAPADGQFGVLLERINQLDVAVAKFEELEERRLRTVGEVIVAPLIEHGRDLQVQNAALERQLGRLEAERDALQQQNQELRARQEAAQLAQLPAARPEPPRRFRLFRTA